MTLPRLPDSVWLTSTSDRLLSVPSDTPVQAVVRAMHRECVSSALVLEQQRLIGVFTAQDLVAAIASGRPLEGAIADYLRRSPPARVAAKPVAAQIAEPTAPCSMRALPAPAVEEQLRSQAQREQALSRVIQAIRNSLNLNTVFATATKEVVQLLQADRASIAQYLPNESSWLSVASYETQQAVPSLQNFRVPDADNPISARLKRFEVVHIRDANALTDCVNQEFARLFPGEWLLVPLSYGGAIWGSLNLVRCSAEQATAGEAASPAPPIFWQDAEISLVMAIADQLAIAIHQSQLYQQVQQLNASLETQVQERTAQLQTLLKFEALLRRITDKVRESLDEHQIINAAVQELAQQLGISFCNAVFYQEVTAEGEQLTIVSEVNNAAPALNGLILSEAEFPIIQTQMCSGESCQFCTKIEGWGWATLLICPMMDSDRTLLGDLLLLRSHDAIFDKLETRLVEQVAGQCAIAIRQSRLYEAAQMQVEELERLSQLKDDFLSTVSHELRTPISNIRMTAEMLELKLKQHDIWAGSASHTAESIAHYVRILKEECHREIGLIDDLLDISRLESSIDPLLLSTQSLQVWLPQLTAGFLDRLRAQQQQLQFDLPQTLPPLTTDFTHLERILVELLQNACKYTPTGGTIALAAAARAGQFQLRVANSGIEIPPVEHERIFDKFYRIASNDPWKHGGTGLGLALVKKRVERIEGTIAVSTQPNWTVFTLTLPLQLTTSPL